MLAQPSDVETSLVRGLTPDESTHVGSLITRAESLIEEEVTDFTEKTTAGGESYDASFVKKVIHIVADAVARVLRNPGAFRQETEGNYSYTLDAQAASGLLSISAAEWERLGVKTDEFGTHSTIVDGYAAKRYGNYYIPAELRFQYGWPAPDNDNAEVIL